MFFKNIVIADKECLHRIGLKHVLQKHLQHSQIQELHDRATVFRQLKKQPVDLLVIDPQKVHGFQTSDISLIKNTHPECCVIIITDCQNQQNISLLLQSGINAYVSKNCEEQFIIDALAKIEKGGRYVCPEVYSLMVDRFFEMDNGKGLHLTPRELEIVRQIAKGNKGNSIANELFISIHTFRTHRKNIMKKIGVNSTSEIILYALKNKIK
ncbi:LuxR C-terminal-related transcriptional regulator [Flavobacterium humi]|uniref:Response regulator transcription factor n=1 Tax=Flavobacterium humi TaxID=2562683 RepID=A0A4Z0L7D1_9FLAO|nr:response regulator transcription factor [Flavobacterium humi]TGD57025.1 response regulator transcription factor [Flavobacterium humi]